MLAPCRLLVVALALAGCGPLGVAPGSRAGRDGSVEGARQLRFSRGAPDDKVVDGVVTARGGDPVDWYAFEVDDACVSIEVQVRAQAGRPGTRLVLDVVDPLGHSKRKRLARRGRIRVFAAPRGHYHARVAVEGDGAAGYALTIHDATDGMECEGPPPPHPIDVRPAPQAVLPPAPPDAVAVPIIAWETWDGWQDQPQVLARLGAGLDDGLAPGDAGQVVDGRGGVVAGVELIVGDSEAHTALGELRGGVPADTIIAGAFIRRQPPPPPPLTLDVIDRWSDGARPALLLRGGRWEGVAVGWRGTLVDRDQHPIGRLEVAEVEPHRSRALVIGATLADVLAARAAIVAPP